MTFNEAINEVVHHNVIVKRKAFSHPNDSKGFWSSWIRIRLDDDPVPSDAFIMFQTNGWDDVQKCWLWQWAEDELSKADVLANDWEKEED